jgi:hypothetical protein
MLVVAIKFGDRGLNKMGILCHDGTLKKKEERSEKKERETRDEVAVTVVTTTVTVTGERKFVMKKRLHARARSYERCRLGIPLVRISAISYYYSHHQQCLL